MSEITTPRELFVHELGDILYVERQLASEALPKLISEVQDTEFREALESHLKQTRGHVSNVERVFEMLGEEPSAEKCLGFEGLKAEHDKMLEETSRDLIDSVDLGAAARTENYEIAAYEGLRRMAKALGEDEAVDLLDANLKEEKEALRQVEKIATRVSNEAAKDRRLTNPTGGGHALAAARRTLTAESFCQRACGSRLDEGVAQEARCAAPPCQIRVRSRRPTATDADAVRSRERLDSSTDTTLRPTLTLAGQIVTPEVADSSPVAPVQDCRMSPGPPFAPSRPRLGPGRGPELGLRVVHDLADFLSAPAGLRDLRRPGERLVA